MKTLQPYNPNHRPAHSNTPQMASIPDAEPGIRPYVLAGVFTLAAFVGGFAYWTLETQLDGAVVAPATVVVEGDRQTVQHIDGGIIAEVLVNDGAPVEKGQPLIQLDTAQIDVNLDVLGTQLGELAARHARLTAQLKGDPTLDEGKFISSLQLPLERKHWVAALATQHRLFSVESRARQAEAEIATQRIASFQDQIAALDRQTASITRQLEIGQQELEGLTQLAEKGLVAQPRINARQIESERLRGSKASLQGQKIQAQNQIEEIRLSQASLGQQRDEALTAELYAVEAQRALLVPQYEGALDLLARAQVVAPLSGRIVNLVASRPGGVIRPGQPILDIVPDQSGNIVEARINPSDRERLALGQDVRIRLSAFAGAQAPEATGQVYHLSADALEDERTGEAYYLARVRLDDVQIAEVAALELLPGMPADIFVQTGERTTFDYLTQPIQDRLAQTFTE